MCEDESSIDLKELLDCTNKILYEQGEKSQRVTGLKLVDILKRQDIVTDSLKRITAPASPSPSLKVRFCEFFIAWCLAHRLIKMEFHFTPYSTIVYLTAKSGQTLPSSRFQVPDWLLADDEDARENLKSTKKSKTIGRAIKRSAESFIEIDST